MPGVAKHVLPFNSQAVMKAAPRGGKLTEWKVANVPGLVLLVQPTGVATYFVRYQFRYGGKRKFRRMRIGDRALITLQDARRQALDIMTEIEAGNDPVQIAKTEASRITFQQL